MKTNNLLKQSVVITLLSLLIFIISTTTALADSPDNDHTPIYSSSGELLYPIYNQSRFSNAMRMTASSSIPHSCGLPAPVADGRYGDVRADDNWARVAVAACDGKLVGVAWSAWPGRDPISTGHDKQNLWVNIEVVDLTTGQTIENIARHLTNNPRVEGVLSVAYDFELPADGHDYELRISAKVRQNTCGNGSGSDSDSIIGSKKPKAKLQVELTCIGARFDGYAQSPMELVYHLSDGQAGTIWVEGWFSEIVEWNPEINQRYGPHDVSAKAELKVNNRVLKTDQVNKQLVCGSPDPEINIILTCDGVKFTGYVEVPMDLVYRLSDGQADIIRVEDNFSETVAWNPPINGTHGPHDVYAEAETVFEGQILSSGQASARLTCGEPLVAAQCALVSQSDGRGNTLVNLEAVDEDGNSVPIEAWFSESSFDSNQVSANSADLLPTTIRFPETPGRHWVQFEVLAGGIRLGGQACRIEHDVHSDDGGQYQDFIGAVPFGTFTPYLEPGKEYFDGTRSLMFNVEFIADNGQGDVVFRFNGQEASDVTVSIFNNNAFRQFDTDGGRAVTQLDDGVTQLIAYRYGAEQARVFQTISLDDIRWIHPLDQPFEHKYEFELELHGPANATDLLVYGDEHRQIHYDENGIATVELTYTEAGLVAIYPVDEGEAEVEWITVDATGYPISTTKTVYYDFVETGLYHYRLVDTTGQMITEPSGNSHIEFNAEPGVTYYAQLAYPATSLFVGLYDDMKFEHPDHWTMPIDASAEHDFEFHLDYHRLDDPDLGNDHIRGDVVVDALYLTNGTTSVAQQFPYGRHDGSLPGVTIMGIPNVSMVAFCQRPGMHEVVYWGGWENESYYLPDRSWVFDEELYNEWNDDQRGDCIDAAQRVNMELARQGLRTDHTYRHHGELSQGYQMAQQNIWSAYNLVGLRPPHIGKFLKPGAVLSYYNDPADTLFWGWDLEKSGLADGIGATELQQYVDSLGPVVYGDQTGIHPPEEL